MGTRSARRQARARSRRQPARVRSVRQPGKGGGLRPPRSRSHGVRLPCHRIPRDGRARALPGTVRGRDRGRRHIARWPPRSRSSCAPTRNERTHSDDRETRRLPSSIPRTHAIEPLPTSPGSSRRSQQASGPRSTRSFHPAIFFTSRASGGCCVDGSRPSGADSSKPTPGVDRVRQPLTCPRTGETRRPFGFRGAPRARLVR